MIQTSTLTTNKVTECTKLNFLQMYMFVDGIFLLSSKAPSLTKFYRKIIYKTLKIYISYKKTKTSELLINKTY